MRMRGYFPVLKGAFAFAFFPQLGKKTLGKEDRLRGDALHVCFTQAKKNMGYFDTFKSNENEIRIKRKQDQMKANLNAIRFTPQTDNPYSISIPHDREAASRVRSAPLKCEPPENAQEAPENPPERTHSREKGSHPIQCNRGCVRHRGPCSAQRGSSSERNSCDCGNRPAGAGRYFKRFKHFKQRH